MSHRVLVLLGTVALMLSAGPAAQAKTCPTEKGSYNVTAPASRADKGGDPAEDAAVNCALGYHEKKEYPLSLIGVALAMTAFGLILIVARRKDYDVLGGEA